MKKLWLFCISILLVSCYNPSKLAVDLGKERAEKHLKDPKFSRVYFVEENNSSDDAFRSYVCGYADFKDMYGNYYGFPLRFFVKVDITKNGSLIDTETSNFTIEPLINKEWFEKKWKANCNKND
ncbi:MULTISPECIES: hypothetical protein [unclassified Gilliamella]|uniref:hypothetical protein n=1 Tax=unclassified Gilliamella TaxID=2685620 RepID=UPI0022699650|nr:MULTISPECIES: hypothetical protein [unclassified Gilliamella]MCX8665669.1 hypothetical protein [Gilliamella sp. B2887]MCX8698573.1 hypothetical protein [Gilliamella sp. B3000]